MEEGDNILHIADERRFNKMYWFVFILSFALLLFMAALVFVRPPKENTQMANMTLSYLFGLMTGVSGVLIISSPSQKKDPNGVTPNTKQISTTTTATVIDNTKKEGE